jgi:hypothetical protein
VRASNRETRLKAEAPLPAIEEHAERYWRARGPRKRMSLTAALMGDPLPSRSALNVIPRCQDEVRPYKIPGLAKLKFLERG